MSNKYLLLCNGHNSVYDDNWCLWWGDRESKSGYITDLRRAHRFTKDEIEKYKGDEDIAVPVDVLGISEEYEPEETYNENICVMIKKNKINELMGLELRPLFQDEEIWCPVCGCRNLEERENNFGDKVYICEECGYEFEGSEVEQ